LNYLLDTNACIALLNGTPPRVRERYEGAVGEGAQVFVPAVVAFELWYGVSKSQRPAANAQRLGGLLLRTTIQILPFEWEDARAAGSIRALMETAGTPLSAYDYLIAGQALARQMTLITSNVREFRRVRGLTWEDWARL